MLSPLVESARLLCDAQISCIAFNVCMCIGSLCVFALLHWRRARLGVSVSTLCTTTTNILCEYWCCCASVAILRLSVFHFLPLFVPGQRTAYVVLLYVPCLQVRICESMGPLALSYVPNAGSTVFVVAALTFVACFKPKFVDDLKWYFSLLRSLSVSFQHSCWCQYLIDCWCRVTVYDRSVFGHST